MMKWIPESQASHEATPGTASSTVSVPKLKAKAEDDKEEKLYASKN
jgi:hypothetical protein